MLLAYCKNVIPVETGIYKLQFLKKFPLSSEGMPSAVGMTIWNTWLIDRLQK
jgi:hypothetical protein